MTAIETDGVMRSSRPDLICIGAQKAGTTWLHGCLMCHPRVARHPVKEVHYFDAVAVPSMAAFNVSHFREATREVARLRAAGRPVPPLIQWRAEQHGRTIDDAWYADVFSNAPEGAVRMDITPAYSLLPDAGVDHVVRLCPDARILLMLRDPVARSFSQIRMEITRNEAPIDTRTMLGLARQQHVVERSRYVEMLDRWSARVPPERFKVVFHDDIAVRPMALLEEICAFVGLDFEPRYFSEVATTVVFRGPEIEMPDEVRDFLVREHMPVIQSLARTYPQAQDWLCRYA